MRLLWNPDAFRRIDSEGMAWLVGWLHARGGLTHYKGHSYLNLFIPSEDRGLVPVIQELLGHRGVVVRDRGRTYFRIRMNADGMEERLAALGVGEGRTPKQRVPPSLRHHFFRAMIESRGTWRRRGGSWHLHISHSSLPKLEFLRTWLEEIGCEGRMSIQDQGDVHVLRLYRRKDLLRVYGRIYACTPRFTIQRQRESAGRAILRQGSSSRPPARTRSAPHPT